MATVAVATLTVGLVLGDISRSLALSLIYITAVVAAIVLACSIMLMRYWSATIAPRLDELRAGQQEYGRTAERAIGIVIGAEIATSVPPRLRVVGDRPH